MPTRTPSVAICMATFDPEPRLLERQIASIQAQTHPAWTCLISDDGSSEERFGALLRLTAEDPRFKVSRGQERLGFYLNFERALRMVPREADFVALADQDDRWYPEKLATLVQACGGARLAYSDMRIVEESGRVIAETFWRGRRNNFTNLTSLLLSNTVTGAASLFERQLLDLVLPFPPRIGDAFHDQWIASVALATGPLAYVDRPLYDYVQHGGAARGHEAAMREWNPRRLLSWREPREGLRRVGAHAERSYETNVRRIALAARTIEARAGATMEPGKARAVRRLVRLERSRAAAGWLALRWLRRFAGRNETMGIELSLASAVAWHGLAGNRAGARSEG
jgi:glycosyltransferase involved in cell wall biosynthesis